MDILRSDVTPLLVQLRVLGSWWHLLKYSYGQMDILNSNYTPLYIQLGELDRWRQLEVPNGAMGRWTFEKSN